MNAVTVDDDRTVPGAPSEIGRDGLELARFGARFWALLFDIWLLWFWGSALKRLIEGAFGDPEVLGPMNLTTIFVLLAAWAYFVVATALSGGTLGKRALQLRVVSRTYERPTWSTVFYREVVGRIIAGSSLFIGYLWAAFDKDRQGWHDKIADTYVMRKVKPVTMNDPWEDHDDEDGNGTEATSGD